MPYEGQYANYGPLRRIVQNDRVRKLLGRYRIRERGEDSGDIELPLVPVTPSEWQPDWVLAIDGSYSPVAIENGFPGAETAYVTVAAVLLDIQKVTALDALRPVDPVEFRTTERAQSVDFVIPGCNVVLDAEQTAVDSMRRALFDVLAGERSFDDGESLLDTYDALFQSKPDNRVQQCPYQDCFDPKRRFIPGSGRYTCHCMWGKSLYSTDGLRIREGMNDGGPNGAMYQEILQVVERLWIFNFLRSLEQRKWLSSLKRIAIVLDGPMAVFGHPAWISQRMHSELVRLNQLIRCATGGLDLLLMGIEKTGQFVEHLNLIDLYANGTTGRFPEQGVALLTDQYIKRNIIFSASPKPYGQDTYFGRKFFYKTHTGGLIVGTLPILDADDADFDNPGPFAYPRLADALSLLDQVVSSRYENALTPIVSAHAEAAIPLHFGTKVLEQLARELMVDSR